MVSKVDVRNLATFATELGKKVFEFLDHPELDAEAVTFSVANVVGISIVSDLATSLEDLSLTESQF